MIPCAYKWRHLAKIFFYLANIETCVMAVIIEQEFTSIYFIFLLACFLLFVFYCAGGAQIIFGAFTLGLNLFFLVPHAYSLPYDLRNCGLSTILILTYVVVALKYAILIKQFELEHESHLGKQLARAQR